MEKFKKIKNFLFDVFINLLASAIQIAVLQFFVFPKISNTVSVEVFGTILVLISLKNIFSQTFGGSLNNIRLINQKDEILSSNRDYNLILTISNLVVVFLFLISLSYYGDIVTSFETIILTVFVVLANIRSFYTVYYRIDLKFKKILTINLIGSLGLVIGLYLYLSNVFHTWVLIFLLYEVFSIAYLFYTKNISFNYSKNFASFMTISKQYYHLIVANFIANATVYLDRLLIFPLLGAEKVAIFYAATLVSKTAAIIITPLNSVILSYSTKTKTMLSLRKFCILGILIAVFVIIGTYILDKVTYYVLLSLYPELAVNALEYITVANIGVLIGMGANIIYPLVLSWSNIKWQKKINATYGIAFLVFGITLSEYLGLNGFFIALIISNCIRFLFLFILGSYSISKKQ